MTTAKIRSLAIARTKEIENLLIAYAFHPASANMLWHGRATLRGMCAIGSVLLAEKLQEDGLEAYPVFGYFLPPSPLPDHIKDHGHCWVVCHNGSTKKGIYLCDPTGRQFSPNLVSHILPLRNARKQGYHPKGKPRHFTKWPPHCHPHHKNAMGCDHQTWLKEYQKPWNPL